MAEVTRWIPTRGARLAKTSTQWKGAWAPGEYEQFEQVRDGSWLMIANKTTSDRPAPESLGDPSFIFDENPAWEDANVTGDVWYGYDIEVTGLAVISSLRTWVSEGASSQEYTTSLLDITDPAQILLLHTYNIAAGGPFGWSEDPAPEAVIGSGQRLRVVTKAHSVLGDTSFSSPWDHLTTGTVPASGDAITVSAVELRINVEDNLAADRGADLRLLVKDDEITITETLTPRRTATYRLDAAFTDNTTYLVFPVFLELFDQAPRSGREVTITWVTHGVPQATKNVIITDGLLAYPELGSVKGWDTQDSDEVIGSPTLNDNQYGVDLRVEAFTPSPDWDLQAISEGASAGSAVGGLELSSVDSSVVLAPPKEVTTDYQILDTDFAIVIKADDVTVTMVALDEVPRGRRFEIKVDGHSGCRLLSKVGEPVDGSESWSLDTRGNFTARKLDAASWIIV